MNLSKRTSYIIIATVLFVVAIFYFCRVFLRVPISDDLLYRFILGDKILGSGVYDSQITCFADALRSQSMQYFGSNGRFIIHTMVQMFTAVWGLTAYSIVNTLMFVVSLLLFGWYTFGKKNMSSVLLWMLTVVFFLYLFPGGSRVWYSIAGGMNYLYPLMLSLIYFITLQSGLKNSSHSTLSYIGAILLAFIMGWCMECYSLPLCGATFFYLVFNFKTLRKEGKLGWMLALSLPLWIGGLVLIGAPGNYNRVGISGSMIMTIFKALKFIVKTIPFWATIIGLGIFAAMRREQFKVFIKDNLFLVYCSAVAVALGFVANSSIQSFYGVAFFPGLLLFRMLGEFDFFKRPVANLISLILAAGLIVHQYRIYRVVDELHNVHTQFVGEYLASTDGVMEVKTYSCPADCKPFVNSWFDGEHHDWDMFTLNRYYCNNEKEITLLSSKDYAVFRDSADMQSLKAIPGSALAFESDKYLICDSANVHVGDTIQLAWAPSNGLKYKILGIVGFKAPVSYETVVSDTVMRSQSGRTIMLDIPFPNPIKADRR